MSERYRAAGVDLSAADEAKRQINAALTSARTALTRGRVGGFGGIVRIPEGIADPVLVMSTDGVGTKVLVAAAAGRHDTVGEDLVNHCVNDILVHGARPLAFLDYIATATMDPAVVAQLVEGVARGCRQHDMSLAGGETAQMPELYRPGQYDLAGTIVGIAPERSVLEGDAVTTGDLLVGYASSGLHTNGYSLARRIIFHDMGLAIDDSLDELGVTVGDALLSVHRSYFRAISPVLGQIHALAHITGGGIPGNLGRSLPPHHRALVRWRTWPIPPLFQLLEDAGQVPADEMLRVFNMGIGMVAAVAPGDADALGVAAAAAGVETWVIGEVIPGDGVAVER